MKRWHTTLAVMGLAWGLRAADTVPAGKAGADLGGTVITSTRLSYDQQQRLAVFEEHVVVTDRELKITADRLNVLFTQDNKVDRIEAQGHVTIARNDLTATAEKAVYDIKEGKMQLTGNPRIQRNQDTLSGGMVTLWRNSKRILCEPNARLVIASDQDLGQSLKE